MGHHCHNSTPLLWPDPPWPPKDDDTVILVPFWAEKSNSCSNETEIEEDRVLTMVGTRAVQTLPIQVRPVRLG